MCFRQLPKFHKKWCTYFSPILPNKMTLIRYIHINLPDSHFTCLIIFIKHFSLQISSVCLSLSYLVIDKLNKSLKVQVFRRCLWETLQQEYVLVSLCATFNMFKVYYDHKANSLLLVQFYEIYLYIIVNEIPYILAWLHQPSCTNLKEIFDWIWL